MLANSGLLVGGTPLVQGLSWEGDIASEVETRLQELYARTEELLQQHRFDVLAVAHALETYSTISGDDVAAVIEQRQGPVVDGTVYAREDFKQSLEEYHRAAVEVHKIRHERPPALPALPQAHG